MGRITAATGVPPPEHADRNACRDDAGRQYDPASHCLGRRQVVSNPDPSQGGYADQDDHEERDGNPNEIVGTHDDGTITRVDD